MNDFEINNNNKLKLSNRCKGWFSLPEKDVYEFIDDIKDNIVFYKSY